MTRPYAEVIGDPIAQSKSPAIHGYWLGRLGLEADYRACHVTPDGLPVGVMLAARPAEERLLISLAAQVETAAPWTHPHVRD